MPLKLTFSKVVVRIVYPEACRRHAEDLLLADEVCRESDGMGRSSRLAEVERACRRPRRLCRRVHVPGKSELQKHAFQLEGAGKVRNFEFVRVQVKKGKSAAKSPTFRTELHCAIDFTDANRGGAKLEAYMQSVDESSMKVTYEKVAEQEELPGVETTDEQRQATMEAND
jgi:hypothetical protein